MPRGPRRDTRDKHEPRPAAPIDLGLALSVYGKSPEGRLIELGNDARMTGEALPDTWPTEQ